MTYRGMKLKLHSTGERSSIARLAGWLAGWLAGCWLAAGARKASFPRGKKLDCSILAGLLAGENAGQPVEGFPACAAGVPPGGRRFSSLSRRSPAPKERLQNRDPQFVCLQPAAWRPAAWYLGAGSLDDNDDEDEDEEDDG